MDILVLLKLPPEIFQALYPGPKDMNNELEEKSSKIAVFKGKQIRKAIHQDEWFFSIIDIIEVLTGSSNPRRYWSDLKSNLVENEGFIQLYGKIVQLKLVATGKGFHKV